MAEHTGKLSINESHLMSSLYIMYEVDTDRNQFQFYSKLEHVYTRGMRPTSEITIIIGFTNIIYGS